MRPFYILAKLKENYDPNYSPTFQIDMLGVICTSLKEAKTLLEFDIYRHYSVLKYDPEYGKYEVYRLGDCHESK